MRVITAVGESTLAQLVDHARKTPPGCFLEVGVYQGGSAWQLQQLAIEQQRALYLYDTFTGIPFADQVDSHQVGDFSDTSIERVRELLPGAVIIAGIFPGSAVPMPPVAFAHLDCDQYRSVKESALYLEPLMVPGGVIWFDDSPCLAGARQATHELFGDRRKLSSTGQHYVEC